jgi:large subunit ribosomal protein L4
MSTVTLFNMQGESIGEVELNDQIFGVEVSDASMHRVVKMHLANRRQGNASVKDRSAVRGGGHKPWRQKGTGRARHGSSRSPIWVGGGTTFGPIPRDFGYRLPKKVRRLALKSALTSKVRDGEFIVVDALTFAEPKTQEMVKVLQNLKAGEKVLLVTAGVEPNVIKSARNIPGVKTIPANQLNVYDILYYHNLLVTQDALTRVEEVFA